MLAALQLLLVFIAVSLPAQAFESRLKCEPKKFGGRTVNWCHEWDVGANSKQVIYYFHGIGGTEKYWQDSPVRLALREAAAKLGKPMPHVFAISFGRAWFLTDVKKARLRSRLDIFLTKIIPASDLELKEKPSRRILLGESMGGYNAIRAGLADSKNFAKVVALCPALLPLGPYASAEEEEAFIARNPHMNPDLMRHLRSWAVEEFPRPEDWTRNNPLEQVEASAQVGATLLSANQEDEYGFQEGTAIFAKKLEKKATASVFRSLGGSHCQHTPELLAETADFLLKP